MAQSFACFQVLAVINITTELAMINIKDTDFVEVLEYNQNHISFEADGESCQAGHLVRVSGVIHLPDGPHPVVCLGKVAESTPQPNQKLTVIVELRSYDQLLWRRFTGYLAKRQEDLDKLFNLMRDAE